MIDSGESIRIALDYDAATVAFYKEDVEFFTQQNIPTGDGTSYRLCVDSDKVGEKYTILKSQAMNTIDLSLVTVMTAMKGLQEELQRAKGQLKECDIEELTKFKQQTTKFMEDCKECEQTFEILKEEVQAFDKEVDKEMKPDPKNYKVTAIYFILALNCV